MFLVTANLAFQLQSLLLSSLRKLSLKRIFLTTIPTFLPIMVPFPFRQSPTLTRLVKRNRMNLMLLTFSTVSCDLFRNIHLYHYQPSIEKTTMFLYFFAILSKC